MYLIFFLAPKGVIENSQSFGVWIPLFVLLEGG